MIGTFHRYLAERSYLVGISILLLTALMLALTLLPVDNVLPSSIWSYDKLGHLLIFGGWTFLVGYYRYLLSPDTLNLFVIFFIGVIFGIGIEILQYAMPLGRNADFFDVAFDAVGCFIAVISLYKITEYDSL